MVTVRDEANMTAIDPIAIMGEFAAVCENSCQAMLACTVTLHGILWEIIAATCGHRVKDVLAMATALDPI